MFVKLMSDVNLADDDSRKPFVLLDGAEYVEMYRDLDGHQHLTVNYPHKSGESYPVVGNVYLMSDAGKTVATFSPSSIPENA